MNAMNEKIAELKAQIGEKAEDEDPDDKQNKNQEDIPNKGKVIYDATDCPQDIAYPTDLNLLTDAREKSEPLIDLLYSPLLHPKKPRIYNKIVRKLYLKTTPKKNKTKKKYVGLLGNNWLIPPGIFNCRCYKQITNICFAKFFLIDFAQCLYFIKYR